jgi:hypothetical protein
MGSQDAAVDIAGYINSPAASVTAGPMRGAAGLSATYEASRYGSVDDVVDVVVDAAKSPRPSADDRETCRGPAGPLVCPAPRPLPGEPVPSSLVDIMSIIGSAITGGVVAVEHGFEPLVSLPGRLRAATRCAQTRNTFPSSEGHS